MARAGRPTLMKLARYQGDFWPGAASRRKVDGEAAPKPAGNPVLDNLHTGVPAATGRVALAGMSCRAPNRLLAGALAAAALLAAGALSPALAPAKAATACNGSATLCDRPLNETVMVGTHNSMASDAYGWSKVITNQTYSIRGQLDRGVRALNFDIHYGTRGAFGIISKAEGPTRPGVEPYLCHALCNLGARRLALAAGEVASFLRDNPRQVVVIQTEEYVSAADIEAALKEGGLWKYVHSGPLTQTLGQMISSGKRVALVAQNISTADQQPWLPRLTTPQTGRDTQYDFKSTAALSDPALQPASCEPSPWGSAGTGRLFLMQHFVTNPLASRAASRVVNAKGVLVSRALACQGLRGVMPSILLVDYFELGQPACAMWDLNGKLARGSGAGARAASGAGPAGCGSAAPRGVKLESLRIAALSDQVPRGGEREVALTLVNRGTRAATARVKLSGSGGTGFSYPRSLAVSVPAQDSVRVDLAVRADSRASGTLRLSASLAGLRSRLALVAR